MNTQQMIVCQQCQQRQLLYCPPPLTSVSAAGMSEQVLVEKALLARIELKLSKPAKKIFSVENVAGNDNLVRFHTGFIDTVYFLLFTNFLVHL